MQPKALLSFLLLAGSASAKTVFSSLAVNGVFQGQGVGIRVPASNNPITDLSSNNIICNTGFITPVSQTVIPVKGGDQFTAIFHKTSAGDPGHGDPADPLDPTNKGPVIAYLAAIPDATQSTVTGLKWFKIFQEGLSNSQWGSDLLYINKGNVTFTIPSCLASGNYLLRVEDIALQNATAYPGAQVFTSCAQLSITGSPRPVSPATVSFPGAYTGTFFVSFMPDPCAQRPYNAATSPGIVVNLWGLTQYTPPGPDVFTC